MYSTVTVSLRVHQDITLIDGPNSLDQGVGCRLYAMVSTEQLSSSCRISMKPQVTDRCAFRNYHLHRLFSIHQYLTADTTETVVQALIISLGCRTIESYYCIKYTDAKPKVLHSHCNRG